MFTIPPSFFSFFKASFIITYFGVISRDSLRLEKEMKKEMDKLKISGIGFRKKDCLCRIESRRNTQEMTGKWR